MPKAEIGSRAAARERELNELEAQRPELSAWLRPLRLSLSSLDTAWKDLVPVCEQERGTDAPLLDGAVLPVDATQLRLHVRTVLHAAFTTDQRSSIDRLDSIALLEFAIARDTDATDQMAETVGLNPHALNAAAQLAAIPLLIASGRSVAAPAIKHWPHGYCYVCGAPPVLAEVLGLERLRQLRCGRCGCGWKTHVLLCPFCGEREHDKLGSLVPEGPLGQICWIENCHTCMTYIKARAALRGVAVEDVLIQDARSLDLDLVAVERGYAKTMDGGVSARVRIANTVAVS
jgi:FdhE protein